MIILKGLTDLQRKTKKFHKSFIEADSNPWLKNFKQLQIKKLILTMQRAKKLLASSESCSNYDILIWRRFRLRC